MATLPKAAKAAAEVIEDTDAALAAQVEPYAETLLVRAMSFACEIGDQPPMRALCGATIAAGLLTGRRRLTHAGIRMLGAHTVATAAKNFVKLRIDRARPNARTNGDDHRLRSGRTASHDQTSFPSGHSAGAVAVGAAFAREYPEHRLAALSAAGAVALAQVPRRSHYLSDVAVGSAIGLISEAALSRLVVAATMWRNGRTADLGRSPSFTGATTERADNG